MYRFALRPRWLVGHAVVLALLVSMVSLGLWQLRRLDERRAFNDRVEQRLAAPVAPIDEVLVEGVDPDDLEWRRVTVTGRFDPSEEVLVRARVRDGVPGFEVATPLVTGDDRAVVVDRGWIPLADGERWPVPAYAPPEGTVTVTGRLHPSQERARFGPSDPEEGELETVARIDLDRLQQQVDDELAPVYLDLVEPAPAGDGYPAPLKLPDLSEGPHLSYAGQWFIFTVIAAVGWVLLIRKSARGRAAGREPVPTAEAAEPAERVSSPS